MQPPLSPRITFTRPSQVVWHVWLDERRVGAVQGDGVVGFTASGNDHRPIGQRYLSAEAAMEAWLPVMDWDAIDWNAIFDTWDSQGPVCRPHGAPGTEES